MGKGYLQVYTGDGKGKTTAALGLAVRAAGAGFRVYIAQFIKSGDYSEIRAMQRFEKEVTVEQFGRGRFIRGRPSDADIQAARQGLMRAADQLSGGAYDVVILDEANVAVTCGLFALDDLLDLVEQKPEGVELVITGRGAAAALMERADLVTEMTAVKHYYEKGVKARTGIEK